jgi:gustatory receptor
VLLARKWKDIISYWYKMEKPFLSEPYEIKGMTLSFKINLIGIIFFVCYMTEHLMFTAMEFEASEIQLAVCNVTSMSVVHNYMRRTRPHLLDVLPYRWWIYPIFQWTLALLAFSWNWVDYFIIILSLGLSTRFNQLNDRLRRTSKHQMGGKFWLETRLHYTGLVELTEFIDERISLLMILSMSHNLLLICTKVFEAVR